MKDHSFNMDGGGGELWVGMRKKPALKEVRKKNEGERSWLVIE